MCATKLTFVQDVFGTQRISESVCSFRQTIFVPNAFETNFGKDVI